MIKTHIPLETTSRVIHFTLVNISTYVYAKSHVEYAGEPLLLLIFSVYVGIRKRR